MRRLENRSCNGVEMIAVQGPQIDMHDNNGLMPQTFARRTQQTTGRKSTTQKFPGTPKNKRDRSKSLRIHGGIDLAGIGQAEAKGKEGLVEVYAAGLHGGDYLNMKGAPCLVSLLAGWPKVRHFVPEFDAAGRAEAIGNGVTRFQVGDGFRIAPGTPSLILLRDRTELSRYPASP